jgi:hypothetical protein
VAEGLARQLDCPRGNLGTNDRRAKQRRESDRGGKVARSTKEGVNPEDAVTYRWKASRVVDIV